MTARELIQALQALPESDKDLEVSTEGCDCNGDVAKVQVYRGKDFEAVELLRS